MISLDKHVLSPPSTRLRPPSLDTLSMVLRSVRVSGAVLFAVDAAAPWVADAPPAREIGERILPDAEHFIEFVWIRSGACWGGLTGEPPTRLEEGDVMLFARGDPHVVSSSPGGHGGMLSSAGGERTQVICGFLGCDTRPTHPLLSALPAAMHVPRQSQYDAMLEQLVELALMESVAAREGGALVIAYLSELLFVEIVRRYVATLPRESVGWFAGLRDENVGRALGKLHDRPAQPWNLGLLARETGMSRSALAGRFSELVGVPPMHYLAQWRMQLASNLLSSTSLRVTEVAERVGYASEAALSRAFKRWSGVAPAEWRRGRRSELTART
jgi:AraC-like DNA-binding protein